MHVRNSFPLFRSLFTRTTATWPLSSNDGCRPPYTTSKDFRRAYELGGNVRGDPWCGRPARYVRFQNQRRRLDPSANISITTASRPHRQRFQTNGDLSNQVPISQAQRQYLKPNCEVSKIVPTFRNQPRNLEINANILNRAPTFPNQQQHSQTNSNISTPAPTFRNQRRRLEPRPTSQIFQPQVHDILNSVSSI